MIYSIIYVTACLKTLDINLSLRYTIYK